MPAIGCEVPGAGGRAQLQLRTDAMNAAANKLKWKFSGGPALLNSDFGEPRTTGSFALCIYDDDNLKIEMQVGPSATLWKPVGSKGFLFKDGAGSNDGITTLKLLGGPAGRAKLQAKGRGANLPLVTSSPTKFFDDMSSVTVQLHEYQGDCFETVFVAADETANDDKQFKAKK